MAGNLIPTGNFTGLYSVSGNQTSAAGSYGNLQVAAYLPTYTGNLGNVNNITANTVNANGFYSNNYYYANGSPLLFQTYGNTNVALFLPINTANVQAGNLSVIGSARTNTISANTYTWGNGVPISFTENYGNANVAAYLPTYGGALSGSNIAVTGSIVGASATVTGNVTANNVIANNITGTLTTVAQPAITSVGTLNSLTVAGAITGQAGISAAGSMLVGNSVIVGNQINSGGNIVSNGSFFGDSITVLGNVDGQNTNITNLATVGIIRTDNFQWANGVPFNPMSAQGNYGNSNVAGYLPFNTANIRSGDLLVNGKLDVNGSIANIDVATFNVETGAISLAYKAPDKTSANGAGLFVGPPGFEYATLQYDGVNDVWDINEAALIRGNLQVAGNILSNAIMAYGNIESTLNVFAPRVQASDLIVTHANLPPGNITGANNIQAQFFWGDGSHLTNVTGQINLLNVTSNIIPDANIAYSLGNATNQWKDLWLSGNTLHMGGSNITVVSGNLLVNNSPVTGAQGPTGSQGPTGPAGVQGTTGAGTQGTTGTQGLTGIQGAIGVQGAVGVGAQGFTGAQGTQGTTGAVGAQGVQGTEGVQGLTGVQGIQGTLGITGAQGATGIQGTTGTQGTDGTTGAQGTTGSQGTIGSQGATGIQGTTGTQGSTGTGLQGTTGAQGGTGAVAEVIGTVASVGGDPQTTLNAAFPSSVDGDGVIANDNQHLWIKTNGVWIDAGSIVGPQGPTGSQGTTGAQGAVGNTGTQGTTGIQGETGSQGTTGTQGTTGATGAQGTTGAVGAQGTTGAGTQGTTGIQGETGSQGTTGAQGTTGDTNYTNANVNAYLGSGTFVGNIYSSTVSTPYALQNYKEVVYALTYGATLTPSPLNGSIQKVTLTGGVTINGLAAGAPAGTNITLILVQDATGGRTLTSTMKFANSFKTLSVDAGAIDIMSIFYDGVNYYATLNTGYA